VEITGRGVLSARPHTVSVDGEPAGTVMDFAGPWRADQRWWASTEAAESARLQVVLTGPGGTEPHSALLLVWRRDTRAWQVEGHYD
jgi:protein ImuB